MSTSKENMFEYDEKIWSEKREWKRRKIRCVAFKNIPKIKETKKKRKKNQMFKTKRFFITDF